MSTNYYLINKADRDKLKGFNKFVEQAIDHLEDILVDASNMYELDCEEEIKDKIEDCKASLSYGLFDAEEIHICKTSSRVTWQINEHYKNLSQFIILYEANQDKYLIEDEYETIFTLDEFLKKISETKGEIRYEHWDFS